MRLRLQLGSQASGHASLADTPLVLRQLQRRFGLPAIKPQSWRELILPAQDGSSWQPGGPGVGGGPLGGDAVGVVPQLELHAAGQASLARTPSALVQLQRRESPATKSQSWLGLFLPTQDGSSWQPGGPGVGGGPLGGEGVGDDGGPPPPPPSTRLIKSYART